jgi:hypothetical protein
MPPLLLGANSPQGKSTEALFLLGKHHFLLLCNVVNVAESTLLNVFTIVDL